MRPGGKRRRWAAQPGQPLPRRSAGCRLAGERSRGGEAAPPPVQVRPGSRSGKTCGALQACQESYDTGSAACPPAAPAEKQASWMPPARAPLARQLHWRGASGWTRHVSIWPKECPAPSHGVAYGAAGGAAGERPPGSWQLHCGDSSLGGAQSQPRELQHGCRQLRQPAVWGHSPVRLHATPVALAEAAARHRGVRPRRRVARRAPTALAPPLRHPPCCSPTPGRLTAALHSPGARCSTCDRRDTRARRCRHVHWKFPSQSRGLLICFAAPATRSCDDATGTTGTLRKQQRAGDARHRVGGPGRCVAGHCARLGT